MSDLFDSPADRWGLIFYNSGLYSRAHTRQEWAQIAHAITIADLRHRDGVRGDNSWCITAIGVYNRLRDANSYADLRAGGPPRWHADEWLIRAWLNAPTIPAQAGHTVLREHGWNDTLDPNRAVSPADLTLLVDLAQDAGVVGEPLHRVSLLSWLRDDGVFSDDSSLVLVWRPEGPNLPSGPVRLDELTGASQTPADRAVAVLSGVAGVANRLLAAAEQEPSTVRGAAAEQVPPAAVHEQSLRSGGRAFRLIAGIADPSPPTLPPPPAPPSPPRNHRA